MIEKTKSNRKRIIIAAILLIFLLVIFLLINSAISGRIINAESKIGKIELEKQALTGKIEYLDGLLKNQSMTYSLVFDGTEESFRESISSQITAKTGDGITPGEAAGIIGNLDNHVNEPVNFTIKGDDYLLVVYKDLIGGEVRYHDKYVLENTDSIDIYFEREVLPIPATENKAGRLIYHWIKVLKISCGYPYEVYREQNAVIHIIE